MCNLYSLSCKENLTLKVGAIQLRQFTRLHPSSWLEAGSIQIPELRLNGKLECHTPTLTHQNEQIEYLRRHDQQSQRLHFLYYNKSHLSNSNSTSRRPSTISLTQNNNNPMSCACLGGSPLYFTLVSGEQFFKSSFRLSEQPSFGLSLFQPDVHVIYSHPIFEQKYSWDNYSRRNLVEGLCPNEEIFYPFDFCSQTNPSEMKTKISSPLSRTSSARYAQRPKSTLIHQHKRSLSSIPLTSYEVNSVSSSTLTSDKYLTPNARLSLNSTSETSLQSIPERIIRSPSNSSLTTMQRQLSEQAPSTIVDESDDSSSEDSLAALEEILEQQQQIRTKTSTVKTTVLPTSPPPPPSTTNPSWIDLNNQMKIPIPKSTLLCTTYIRYLFSLSFNNMGKSIFFSSNI